MGLFSKKFCDICGEKIGLLGNRKLEDGNLCKDCAGLLSPWFDERRHSTVEQIKAQLDYREANKQAVQSFHTTASYGDNVKLLVDEDAKKFVVTSASNLVNANPDVIDFSLVTGVDIDIDEDSSEDLQEVKKQDGTTEEVSYNPPRFYWNYNFNIVIRVNTPFFDEIRFRLNRSEVELNPDRAVASMFKPNAQSCMEYVKYDTMAKEIKEVLTNARQQHREEVVAAAAPKANVVCPFCGATTAVGAAGICEFCGGALK